MQNPFSLTFGKKPVEYIERNENRLTIQDAFMAEPASNHVFLITGLRGSGKTVLLNTIANTFGEEEEWVVVRLSAMRDMLHVLAAKLYADQKVSAAFVEAKIDLSLLGIGIRIESGSPIADEEVAIERMMKILAKKNKRLLIAVDEASNTEQMRIFASVYQILLGQDYPVFLIMTGLYEHITALQNAKNMTFLLRAPKIVLEPLNYTAIRMNYMRTLQIDQKTAEKMASLVKGYSFAFQVLGFLYYRDRPFNLDDIYPQFDQLMEEYVYARIWTELSANMKTIVRAMAENNITQVAAIREKIEMDSNTFNTYRTRLMQKGILRAGAYGEVDFTLPRFGEFVRTR